MQNLLEKGIEKKIDGKRIILAVSGGADSMALLYSFYDMQKKGVANFYMEVVHVNHNLRGVESFGDEQFVKKECEKLGINCKIIQIDVKKHKASTKQTIEQAARDLRYKALFDYKKEKCFDYIITAHNSDDQAETVLMHIFRGAGLDGAQGIRNQEGVLRPLLNVSKKRIVEFDNKNNILFRTDSSNNDVAYTRNFIRHNILPKIEEVYPNIKENLNKFANIVQKDARFIDEYVDEGLIVCKNKKVMLKNEASLLDDVILTRLIRKCFNLLGEYADFEQKHIELVKTVFLMKNGNSVNMPHGVIVEKSYNYVNFYKYIPKKVQNNIKFEIGEIFVADKKIIVREVESESIVFGNGVLYYDLDSVPANAVVRTALPGDVFQKLGSEGSKKLTKYFIDKKIPRSEREILPVVACENNVLCVVGYDISDNIKITSDTMRFGEIYFE